MKRTGIGVLICLFATTLAIGQTNETTLKGRVLTATGNGVADVNVYISHAREKYRVFASCLSSEDRSYMLRFRSGEDTLCLHVSGLGITPAAVMCRNRSGELNICVEEKVQRLQEVVVRAPKIYTQGDTVSYHVQAFQMKNDISIGQVLKRLPGVTVSTTGEIAYKGKAIKKFYIEGMDLLKGRYGIATNNIDPNSISTIQVLENHQDIKALRDLRPEERASINLKLKSGVRGVFNLIATLGGGSDGDALWSNELLATCFRRNSQLLAAYKGNNCGTDLEAELRSFDSDDVPRTAELMETTLPAAPGIEKKAYYRNRTHAATYNHLFRIGREKELSLNAGYLNDRDRRSRRSVTSHLLPDGERNIVEELFDGSLKRETTHACLTFQENSERRYLKEQVKFDYTFGALKKNFQCGENIVSAHRNENYRLHHRLHLTRRTEKQKGVELLSQLHLEKRPHRLSVSPNLFPDIVEESFLLQTAERRHLSTENRLSRLSAQVWGRLQLHPTLFADYTDDELRSTLADYRNHLRLSKLHTGIGLLGNLRLPQWQADWQLTADWRHTRLDRRRSGAVSSRSRLGIEPQLTLRYTPGGSHEVRFHGSMAYVQPSIENLYDQYILTDYRQLSAYEQGGLYQAQVLLIVSLIPIRIFMRKVSLAGFILALVSANALAQLTPAPQPLDRYQTLDTARVEVRYTLKFKQSRSAKEAHEDIRVLQIGRRVAKEYSDIVYHYDSLATENFRKGLSTANNLHPTLPCELIHAVGKGETEVKYRLILNAGVLCYRENRTAMEWQFQDGETRRILGYDCGCATVCFSGRRYKAWYTQDIPLPHGPYKFHGLPGLILRIEDDEGLFCWEAFSIRQVGTPIRRYSYEREQKCSRKEALKTVERMMTRPITFLSSAGSKIMVRGSDGRFGAANGQGEAAQEYESIEKE